MDLRHRARQYAPGEKRHYFAQLCAYQIIPEEELFTREEVRLHQSIQAIVSRAGIRVDCEACGEEIVNERQVIREGQVLCRSCAGDGYYSEL